MSGLEDGRGGTRMLPDSPLFQESEFARVRDPAWEERVEAAPSSVLLQAQIASPVVPLGTWEAAPEADRGSARLTALVESLHRCDPSDYVAMLRIATDVHEVLHSCRGAAQVYEGFGAHGGFLVVVQLLSALQLGDSDGSRLVRSQLLLQALTLLSDAITYSRANLAAFAQMPGWDGFFASLELAAHASVQAPMASRMAALLFGLSTGDVPGGAQHFGAVWQALRHALTPHATIDGVHAELPHWRAHAVVHARAVEGALRIAESDEAVLVACYALLDDLMCVPRNVVVLARSPLVTRMLRIWLATQPGATPLQRLLNAWRERMLHTLLADGVRAPEDVRALLMQLQRGSLDAQRPVLRLLQHVAMSAHRFAALAFAPSGAPGGSGAYVAALDRAFPNEAPASSGYTLVLRLCVDRMHGSGTLVLLQIGTATRLALDLATRTLVYGSAAEVLPRAVLHPGMWHHLVLTHARAAHGVPSVLHVYVDGQRVCSPQVGYPAAQAQAPVCIGSVAHQPGTGGASAASAAAWSLGALLVLDGVVPSSVPLLLAALPPQYNGNLQGALAPFLTHEARVRMQTRLEQLAAVGARAGGVPLTALHALHTALYVSGAEVFPLHQFYVHLVAAHTLRTPHGVLLLNQTFPSVAAAVQSPAGHARVVGVPTITVPSDLGDAIWAAGGATSLLQLVERADTHAALAAAVRLFVTLVAHTWRLAEDAARWGAYSVLGVLLRDKSALLSEDVLDALLDASGARSQLANFPLYHATLLDVAVWADAPLAVQRAYLAHVATLYAQPHQARRLARAPWMRRLLYFVRLCPAHADALCVPLADAVDRVLEAQFAPRSVQALLLFLVTHLAPWTPPAYLGGTCARTAEDVDAPRVECAAEAVPAREPARDARLERVAYVLLHRLCAAVARDAMRAARLARCASAQWVLLLLRPGIDGAVLTHAVPLAARLLEHAAFVEQWDALGGFRVLERALPPAYDTPGVLDALWHMLLGPRPREWSLYDTYQPRAAHQANVQHPAALRVLVLCVAEGVGRARRAPRSGARLRRRSLPDAASLSTYVARRAALHDTVRLLVAYAPHPPVTRLLLLAPTLLCLFHAVCPLLDDVPLDAFATQLCTDLLEMLAARIAASVTASGTLSLLTSAHQAMPTPDPVLQSRLCARVYERVLAHVFPLPTRTRATLGMGAALLKLASNESIAHPTLQAALFAAGDALLDSAHGALPPRARTQAAVGLRRNVLHAYASTPLDAPETPASRFCARHWAQLESDMGFAQCVVNRTVAHLRVRFDEASARTLLSVRTTHPAVILAADLDPVLDAIGATRAIELPAAPYAAAWAAAAADQAAFGTHLRTERVRLIYGAQGTTSTRAQGVLATHARIAPWHASICEADRIKFARFVQDCREDAHYVRHAWSEASEALALQRGAPHDWQLDATEGPGRARIKLCPVPRSDAVPVEREDPHAMRAALAETTLAGDGARDAAVLSEADLGAALAAEAPPAHATPAAPPPAPLCGAPTHSSDSFAQNVEDAFRCVLRALHPGETIEEVVNTTRVLGIEARSTLLVSTARHLYLFDGYFQRSGGEVCHVAAVPPHERDALIAAAFDGAPPAAPPPEGAVVRPWPWASLSLCLQRAYLHRRTALELFFAEGRSCLLVLADRAAVERMLAHVRLKAPPALAAAEHMASGLREAPHVPPAAARLSGVLRRGPAPGPTTRAWQEGRLSNAAYLMALNTLAGRTMNDVSQFPVFPWVLADYTSGTLDLEDARSFRDLSRPMGAQTAARRAESAERYQQLLEVQMDPFHYGTHYSTASSVCGFLVRLRPFAHWLVELQGGSFDLADRMFASVGRAWYSASEHARGDVRELVPELFFLPELFLNTNQFAFGRTQAGASIDDVELPPWAHNDPWLFVQRHREALESPYVSAHLHAWIDLVFGYKARGQAAVDALNVFHPLSYADSVDLEQIDSAHERAATAQVIHNFGQTPSALFTRPHPPREVRLTPDLALTPHALIQAAAPTLRLPTPVHALAGDPDAVRGAVREQALLPDLILTYGHIDGSVRFLPLDDVHAVAVAEQVAPTRVTTLALVGTSYAVMGAEDGTVQLYAVHLNARQLEPLAVWSGHAGPVVCAAASATYGLVVTGGADHTALVWDVTRRRYVRALHGHAQPVCHAAIDEQRGWIATAAGDELCLYSINGHLLVRQSTRTATRSALSALAFCARDVHMGHLAVVLTGHAGQVLVWNVVSHHEATAPDAPRWRLALQTTLPARSSAAITALHLPTPETLCTGDEQGAVYVWALPGAAVSPHGMADHACMNHATCGKRFGFLEMKRMCGSCGGVFCSACTSVHGTTRLCGACNETLTERGVALL